MNIFDYFRHKTLPSTYIIPANFNGEVRIAFGLDCGIEPEIKNGFRVLKIPANGILLLKSEYKDGIINSENEHYYFEGKTGIEIPQIYWEHQKDSLKQSYMHGYYTKLDGKLFKYKADIPFITFHIYNNDTINLTPELVYKYSQQSDSVFESEIKKCVTKRTFSI